MQSVETHYLKTLLLMKTVSVILLIRVLLKIHVSYPINHIKKIVRPISHGPHAKNVIFLSADAFGALPQLAF